MVFIPQRIVFLYCWRAIFLTHYHYFCACSSFYLFKVYICFIFICSQSIRSDGQVFLIHIKIIYIFMLYHVVWFLLSTCAFFFTANLFLWTTLSFCKSVFGHNHSMEFPDFFWFRLVFSFSIELIGGKNGIDGGGLYDM